MKRQALTPARTKILHFVVAHCDQFGSPSFAAVALAIGISKSRAGQQIRRLIDDGLLVREPGTAHTLRPSRTGRQLALDGMSGVEGFRRVGP